MRAYPPRVQFLKCPTQVFSFVLLGVPFLDERFGKVEVVDRVRRTDNDKQFALEHFNPWIVRENSNGRDVDLPLRRRRPAPCWSRPGGAQIVYEMY